MFPKSCEDWKDCKLWAEAANGFGCFCAPMLCSAQKSMRYEVPFHPKLCLGDIGN